LNIISIDTISLLPKGATCFKGSKGPQ